MKRINFLIKLYKEEKLKIVGPSEEIKESYIQKSRNAIRSATILLENGQTEDAVPMAYYSMYYILTALLYKVGIKCENHAGSIILLKELFEKDNSKISFAKTERVDKQYYVDFTITVEEVESLITMVKEFNGIIYDFAERITAKQSNEYRDKLRNMAEEIRDRVKKEEHPEEKKS